MEKLKIFVILGSVREQRFGEKPALWIRDRLSQDERLAVQLLDLRDFPLPHFDQPKSPLRVKDGDYGNPVANRWAQKIAEADGFVIVTPEYNHGYPGVLKNALDWVYIEWRRKPVTFVSYGNVGGARAIEQLRQVAVELQMAPIKSAVYLPVAVYFAIMNEPAPVDPAQFAPVDQAASAMCDDLAWWARALREARRRD
jgi:NAD(P)H-dependent FMN reductase